MIKRWIQPLIERDLIEKSCLVIIGSRRAGKTTLIKNISPDNQVYLTMDDVDYQQLFKKDPKSIISHLDKAKLNLIDEVQKAPELFDTIKFLIDTGYKFILTGSSALGLLEKSSETLAGRIRIRECPTLAWGEETGDPLVQKSETIPKEDLSIKEGARFYKNAYSYGGYPEVVLADSEKAKRSLLQDYKNSYLQRDILELSEIQNLDAFRALVAALGRSVGTVCNYHNFSKESGLSFVTTKKYLHSLEQTFIVFKIYPYMFGPAKRYIKSPKWYFSDQGMLKSLNLDISEGALFENFIISQIRKNLILAGEDPANLFFYKSQNGAEVDLIVETTKGKFAFEIKLTNSAESKDTKNLKNLLATEKSFKKGFLISFDPEIEKISDRIMKIPYSFLWKRLLIF